MDRSGRREHVGSHSVLLVQTILPKGKEIGPGGQSDWWWTTSGTMTTTSTHSHTGGIIGGSSVHQRWEKIIKTRGTSGTFCCWSIVGQAVHDALGDKGREVSLDSPSPESMPGTDGGHHGAHTRRGRTPLTGAALAGRCEHRPRRAQPPVVHCRRVVSQAPHECRSGLGFGLW